ncbi:phosphoribosyl-ATP diphosphatase [Acetobacter sp. AN02]|uniref:phosphoribosyl-ATP diphosphatase n=1 Tax=Acetobacter sp. AN02 TaxID=2894186 RepID=UPI002434114B|nr:phosphoribosyl-ATP diphosphatase [Acetobacter sp. AN02]MDG6095388.1 phosphoribosyl-ATP diphosphatase [Acetobacter sp. AN02]
MAKAPSAGRKTGKTAADKTGTTVKKAPAATKTPAKKATARKAATQPDAAVLERLYEVVLSRRGTDPGVSHSARLLSRGTRKVAQKFGEEAVECLIEAVAGRTRELIGESADVLYHLIVMWVDAGVTPEDVWAELKRREGTSGVEEKASRTVRN